MIEGFTYSMTSTSDGLSMTFENNSGQVAEVEILLPEGAEILDPEGEVILTVTGNPKKSKLRIP